MMRASKTDIQTIYNELGVNEIVHYLPISYFDQDIDSYQESLIQAYHVNYYYGIYQYAFLAYHMLFMSYIYKTFWTYSHFSHNNAKKYTDALLFFKRNPYGKFTQYYSPFDINCIGEIEAKEIFAEIDGIKKEDITKFMKIRNTCAHPNGRLYYTQGQIDGYTEELLALVKDIESRKQKVFFSKFLSPNQLKKDAYDNMVIANKILLSERELALLYQDKNKYRLIEEKLLITKILLDEDYYTYTEQVENFSLEELYERIEGTYQGSILQLFKEELLEHILALDEYVYTQTQKWLVKRKYLTENDIL